MNVPTRKQFWFNRIEDWRKSGFTVVQYCKDHGISIKTFGGWRKRYEVEKSENFALENQQLSIQPKFIAGRVVHGNALPVMSVISLEHPSGWRLNLPAETSAIRLAELLRAICA